MFDAAVEESGVLVGEDWDAWCAAVWGGPVPDPEDVGQVRCSQRVPSGVAALELDQASTDPAGLSDAELIEAVVGFDRIESWAAARQARLLAEFARRRPPDSWQARRSERPSRCSEFAPDEVGLALRLSRPAAANRLAVATIVVEELPATLAGWEAGRLDGSKVRAICDTADQLPPETWPRLEARVLGRAPEQTLALLRRSLARAVLALDPQGAQRRHQDQHRDRRVVMTPEPDGMASLWALLTAPDATAITTHLGELARSLGAADERSMDARRADLLVDLLTGRRCAGPGCGADPRPPGKPLVQVTVPITTLMGLDEAPGELAGYGPIPAPLARDIAAGGTWRRLLTDPVSGTLLDYGRTTYRPPTALADHVRARDVTCRSPICTQPASRTDLDHTLAWDDGGHTAHTNLYGGCRHDHRCKTHAPGWSVTQHDDARITWTTPTGHHYTSHPHDYRPNPATPPESDPDPPPF